MEQREIVKKERRDGRKCVKKVEEEEKKELPQPVIEVKKVESWIYEKDDYSEKPDTEKSKRNCVSVKEASAGFALEKNLLAHLKIFLRKKFESSFKQKFISSV